MFNPKGKQGVEVEKEFEKIFSTIDTSGDGNVDCNELIAFFINHCRE